MPLQRLTTRATPKPTKAAARYTPAGGAERCGMCRHYAAPSSCARIEGPISAAGWCQLYSQQVTWRPRAGQDAGLNPGLIPSGVTLDLSFMASGTLDPRITFTRASTATYFDASGTLRTAAINAPRWDYNLSTLALNGLLMEEARTNVLLNSATLGTQSVAVTAQAYTLSFYGTGTITKSGTASGALVGTGAGQRVSQTFTPTAGTLTLTVTGSVLNAQLEAGAFATSYIPTTASAATRALDVCYVPTAGWFSSTTYSLEMEVYIPQAAVPNETYGGISDSNFSNATYLSSGSWSYAVAITGTALIGAAVNKTCGTLVPAGQVKVCNNGNTVVTGTPGGAAQTTATRLGLGNDPWSLTTACNAHVRRVRYWPRILSNAELQSVTA